MSKICSNCGLEVPDDTEYCPSCRYIIESGKAKNEDTDTKSMKELNSHSQKAFITELVCLPFSIILSLIGGFLNGFTLLLILPFLIPLSVFIVVGITLAVISLKSEMRKKSYLGIILAVISIILIPVIFFTVQFLF